MIPLNTHTHYSLLQGYCKPKKLVELAAKYEYSALAVTDLDSLSGTVNFLDAFHNSGIKPIIGTKLKVGDGYLTVLAKNFNGWKELVGLFAHTNIGPLTLEHLRYAPNCIAIVGGYDSLLTGSVIQKKSVFTVNNPSQSLSFYLSTDSEGKIRQSLAELKDVFKDDLYVGVQRCGELPIDKILNDIIEIEAANLSIKRVALNNTYVHNDEELEELRILICSREKSKLSAIKDYVNSDQKGDIFRFFNQSEFGLYDKSYYEKLYPTEYIENTKEILSKIDNFSILKNPQSPNFECPNGMSQKDYLLQLCREGWTRLTPKLNKNKTQEYVARIQYELEVINKVGLEGYFLVVQDYMNWARQRMMVGSGRGSAAGCLTSYFLGITNIDPLKYNLMFERFYNEGRNSPGKISYPDIDSDFPVAGREMVIDYVRNKYGAENVCQVATLSELQGRSALTEVLRISNACPMEFIKEMTKKLPQKHTISDKLEEEKEKSIIRWTLNNEPETLKDWCVYKDGNLEGEYAKYFQTAINIEGTFKSYGKHASAVIIGNEPIASICPMIKDKKSNEFLAAIEFEELELMGLLKFDILGLAILDRLTAVNDLLEYGYIKHVTDIQESCDEEDD